MKPQFSDTAELKVAGDAAVRPEHGTRTQQMWIYEQAHALALQKGLDTTLGSSEIQEITTAYLDIVKVRIDPVLAAMNLLIHPTFLEHQEAWFLHSLCGIGSRFAVFSYMWTQVRTQLSGEGSSRPPQVLESDCEPERRQRDWSPQGKNSLRVLGDTLHSSKPSIE